MPRRRLLTLVSVLLVCSGAAAASRLTFERVVPAPHDLSGVQDLAVLYVIGDHDKITTFLDVFIDQTNGPGTLHVHDATQAGRLLKGQDSRIAIKRIRRQYPADLYLRVNAFTCRAQTKSGQGSTVDYEGKRVKVLQLWSDAVCEAQIEILDGRSLKPLSSFDTRGEGTSPRVEGLITKEESDVAVDQAARYAAVAAAEQITPRRVRESIVLDDTVPDLPEVMGMIDAGHFNEARAIWESDLPRYRTSSPLHLNLAAVCEALGDRPAALRYYTAAHDLSPKNPRFRDHLESFRRRYPSK